MKMVYVLFAALAAGAAIGGVNSLAGSSAKPSADATPAAIAPEPDSRRAPLPADDEQGARTAAIEGQVLELIDVPSYSYLRIGAPGSEGTWVAVTTASVKVGAQVRVPDAMRMENFASAALKRTFPVIYFGTLEGGRPARGMAPLDASDPSKANPHGDGAYGMPLAVDVKPVDRATGANARTIAELLAQRTQLAGKTVRIHATVVKSTPGIMGKTYMHLRDGSGDPAKGTHDVVATTTSTPAVGDVVTIEGTVGLDRDIGAGYTFATIVDDARILNTP